MIVYWVCDRFGYKNTVMYPPGIENLLRPYWIFASILLLLAFAALIVGVFRWKKADTSLSTMLIIIYLSALLFQGFLSMILAYLGYLNGDYSVDALSGNIFMIVEFLIFNILFYHMVRSTVVKTVIKIFVVLFPLVCLAYWW